ncbi:T9SS type A sorting domain-containing protein [Flavobacterium sp.]|uniref:T9SS type A sorting domain-containing protein n=1 Tax=Flavobacterium sp. TaxID=239 RepID=UPI0034282922
MASLYDLQGREVLKQKTDLAVIRLPSLPSGLYVLLLQTKNGQHILRKVAVK